MSDRLHEQLSALLDGELPAGEAELLLARLQRDPALRATLARYTLAGDALRIAALESAPQVAPVASAGFAARLSAAIEAEEQQQASVLAGMGVVEPLPAAALPPRREAARGRAARRGSVGRWLRPLGGVAVAAGVAGLALMVVARGPAGGPAPLVAEQRQVAAPLPVAIAPVVSAGETASPLLAAVAGNNSLQGFDGTGEPASYTTPTRSGGQAATFIPAAELASYVVAHSEVSGPLARRNVLMGLAAEPLPPQGAASVASGSRAPGSQTPPATAAPAVGSDKP